MDPNSLRAQLLLIILLLIHLSIMMQGTGQMMLLQAFPRLPEEEETMEELSNVKGGSDFVVPVFFG